jgi:hypothetical protein
MVDSSRTAVLQEKFFQPQTFDEPGPLFSTNAAEHSTRPSLDGITPSAITKEIAGCAQPLPAWHYQFFIDTVLFAGDFSQIVQQRFKDIGLHKPWICPARPW